MSEQTSQREGGGGGVHARGCGQRDANATRLQSHDKYLGPWLALLEIADVPVALLHALPRRQQPPNLVTSAPISSSAVTIYLAAAAQDSAHAPSRR
jgi:hypothetical protein